VARSAAEPCGASIVESHARGRGALRGGGIFSFSRGRRNPSRAPTCARGPSFKNANLREAYPGVRRTSREATPRGGRTPTRRKTKARQSQFWPRRGTCRARPSRAAKPRRCANLVRRGTACPTRARLGFGENLPRGADPAAAQVFTARRARGGLAGRAGQAREREGRADLFVPNLQRGGMPDVDARHRDVVGERPPSAGADASRGREKGSRAVGTGRAPPDVKGAGSASPSRGDGNGAASGKQIPSLLRGLAPGGSRGRIVGPSVFGLTSAPVFGHGDGLAPNATAGPSAGATSHRDRTACSRKLPIQLGAARSSSWGSFGVLATAQHRGGGGSITIKGKFFEAARARHPWARREARREQRRGGARSASLQQRARP